MARHQAESSREDGTLAGRLDQERLGSGHRFAPGLHDVGHLAVLCYPGGAPGPGLWDG